MPQKAQKKSVLVCDICGNIISVMIQIKQADLADGVMKLRVETAWLKEVKIVKRGKPTLTILTSLTNTTNPATARTYAVPHLTHLHKAQRGSRKVS